MTKAKRTTYITRLRRTRILKKTLWQFIKSWGLPGKQKGASRKVGLVNGDEICFEDLFVASKFNSFFCNIASKLVGKLPQRQYDQAKVDTFYHDKGTIKNSFGFTSISEGETLKLLSSLNIAKSTGHDNIGARFLRDGGNHVVSPLTFIINLSLSVSY